MSKQTNLTSSGMQVYRGKGGKAEEDTAEKTPNTMD